MRAQCEPLRTHPQPPLPTMTCHPNPKGAPAAAAGAGRARCQHVCLLRCVRACACCVACWLQLLCVRSMLASLLACSRPGTNVPVIKTHPCLSSTFRLPLAAAKGSPLIKSIVSAPPLSHQQGWASIAYSEIELNVSGDIVPLKKTCRCCLRAVEGQNGCCP